MFKAMTWKTGPEGVREGVPPHHLAFGEALQPCHLDVVALQHLDQRGPRSSRDVRDGTERQRDRRQDHALQVGPRPLADTDRADRRQHVEDPGRRRR